MSGPRAYLPARKPETDAEVRAHRDRLQLAGIRDERRIADLEAQYDAVKAYAAQAIRQRDALAAALRGLMDAEGGEPGDTPEQRAAWAQAERALAGVRP